MRFSLSRSHYVPCGPVFGVGIQTWSIVLLCKEGKKRRFYVLINIISDMCVQCDWLDGGTARSIHMQRVNNNTENLYHVVCTFIEMNG